MVLGSSEGADDVVQQAMERAWRSLGTFHSGRSFRPWFLRIVANCARNDRRSRGRRAQLRVRATGLATPEDPTPEDHAVSDEERRRVVSALNKIGPADRLVIALRYMEDLSEEEMAEALGCRRGTVKSRLSRARARLEAALGGEDADD